MEITKEQFHTWATENNWLLVNETANMQGKQETYLTGSGEVVFAIYTLSGMLANIAKPTPPPPASQQPVRFNLPPGFGDTLKG
jgi:hypothetical protein